MRTSATPPDEGSSTSGAQSPRRRVQHARSQHACRWPNFVTTCTRCPTGRAACRTARRTTTRRGGSASRTRTSTRLPEGEYEVVVDSTLEPGTLTYGECLIRGASDREVLLSTHVCHPSLANDNITGMALLGVAGAGAAVPDGCGTRTGCCSFPAPSGRSCGSLATSRASTGSITVSSSPGWATPATSRSSGVAAGTPTSTGPSPTCCAPRARAPDPRVLAVRIRRASVLLSGFRPARRPDRPHAPLGVSRVPHVGRRSRLRAARSARGLLRRGDGGDRGARGQSPLPEHPSEGRAAARTARSLPLDRRLAGSARRWRCRCCGC